MANLKKYKIEKLIKFSNPDHFIYDDNNFKTSTESTGTLDIDDLLNKNIYPFYFDFKNKEIIFVETKKDTPHTDTPWLFRLLQTESEYIIPVPFIEIKKLCSGSEFKDSNVLFIHHSRRCGSTLLHKILGSHPNVESFSEDLIIDNLIWQMNTKKVGLSEIKSIYSDILELFRMKWGDRDKSIISLKMSSYSHYFISSIFKMFPDSNHIYLTRNPVDIAISLENFAQSRGGFRNPCIKRKLLGYSDLDYIHHDMIENKGYGRYIYKYITPHLKAVLGPMDIIERSILRVILFDNYYNSIKYKKMLYLTYNELMNKEEIFKTLGAFLQLEEKSFKSEIYNKHSQTGKRYISANTKYFYLTNKQKKKYSLFAERVKIILNSLE